MNENYSPILSKTTKSIFFDYIDTLDIPQIDYFAIGIQNLEKLTSTSIMSLPEWQSNFVYNQYANHDPIRKISLYTKRNIISFDEIDCVDNFGKEIMKQRALFGIKNGMILMERHEKFNYMITLGTNFSKFDSFDFIKRYHDKTHLIKNDMIKIVAKDTENFLMHKIENNLNHLCDDEK